MPELKRTPLYDLHKSLGAKMTAFAGWEMPLEYSGIIDEHLTVRRAVGIFDTSHLGQIEVSGPRALDAIQLLTTNDASRLKDEQAQYSLLCNSDCGILDDVLLYRIREDRFMFCVNAVNTLKVLEWIKANLGSTAAAVDRSSELSMFSIQGPLSQKVMEGVFGVNLSSLCLYNFSVGLILGLDAIISRTGYTGEDGFEVFVPPGVAKDLWTAILEEGRGLGIKPAGLGARDSLRLEMGYPLYGNDISEDTTPLEAGLERFVKFRKPSFIGKDALLKQAREGVKKKYTGFEMVGRGIPRSHYPIHGEGRKIGEVTSGGHAPSLNKFIGMGYVETQFSPIGQKIEIEIRGKMVEAVVVERPFYKR